MSDYPEHDKMAKIADESQAIGEFLEWLTDTRQIQFARYNARGSLVPEPTLTVTLLAEYFEIDLDKIEAEKRQMLEALRAMNEAQA